VRTDSDQHRVKSLVSQFPHCEVAPGDGVELKSDIAGLEDFANLSPTTLRGKRYSGIPRYNIPPATGEASKMVTEYPISARSCAAERPTGPPPMTATLYGSLADDLVVGATGCHDSGPCRSVRKRFRARMEMGLSIWPRRHAVSHGCAQTRPQILAIGFGSRAYLYASSNRPSPISVTYRPALVCAGHAIMQGKLVFSHSRSTFFFAKRLNISPLCDEVSFRSATRVGARRPERTFPRSYFKRVKSALPVPATSTGLVWSFMPSCQATTLYLPSGTLSIL